MLCLVFVVCVDSFIHNLFFDNSLKWASIGDGLILEIIRTYMKVCKCDFSTFSFTFLLTVHTRVVYEVLPMNYISLSFKYAYMVMPH